MRKRNAYIAPGAERCQQRAIGKLESCTGIRNETDVAELASGTKCLRRIRSELLFRLTPSSAAVLRQ
eukprot:6606801-Heterocapsa_arctica.AAC.1